MKITGIGLAVSSGEEPVPWPQRDSAVSRRYRPAASLAEMVHHALAECVARGPIILASCNGKVTTWEDDEWRTSFDLAEIVDREAVNVAEARAKAILERRIVSRPEIEGREAAKVLGRAVASAQCASGMHALYLARALLDAGHPEVTVLAVDIASAPAHDNFEALRVLSDEPEPYTERATGFQLGEAAVAIRLTRDERGVGVVGPRLGHDLDAEDGLDRCLSEVLQRKQGLEVIASSEPDALPSRPHLVVGQGAGPVEGDRAELAAIARHVAHDVTIATALPNAGHTLGASSLLSVALAAASTMSGQRAADAYTLELAERLLRLVPGPSVNGSVAESPVNIDGYGLGAMQALDTHRNVDASSEARAPQTTHAAATHLFDAPHAFDATQGFEERETDAARASPSEPLTVDDPAAANDRIEAPRALDGRRLGVRRGAREAIAVCRALGGGCGAVIVGEVVDQGRPPPSTWGPRSAPAALRDATLRRIAAEADAHRPAQPPDIFIVTLECPLPPAARVGPRILPTSVLEMTPGFIPQLVARAWGFRGPSLCLVGPDPEPLLAALRKTHEHVFRLAIRGMHDRDVEWIPRG